MLCSIGSVLDDQGKYSEALEYCKKSLENKIKVHGPDHPLAADTQNNIAIVFRQQGKYPEALEMYEKALKTRVAMLGPEHPLVATTQNKCAQLFWFLLLLWVE